MFSSENMNTVAHTLSQNNNKDQKQPEHQGQTQNNPEEEQTKGNKLRRYKITVMNLETNLKTNQIVKTIYDKYKEFKPAF